MRHPLWDRRSLFVVCLFSAIAAGAPCESLQTLALKDTTITVAQTVGAGEFVPPQGNGRGGTNPYRISPPSAASPRRSSPPQIQTSRSKCGCRLQVGTD